MTRDGKVLPVQGGAFAVPKMQRTEGVPLFARTLLEGCWSEEEGPPPRLGAEDLQHPEHFHERLAAWLMKQH